MLLLGLFTGIIFGFLLQKGRVAKHDVIVNAFLLKDLTAVKIMATAAAVVLLDFIPSLTLVLWGHRSKLQN